MTDQTQHTPEPWHTENHGTIWIAADDGTLICDYVRGADTAKPNATRIVACVNECAGIATKDLAVVQAAPDLLVALERCFIELGRRGANMCGGPGREEWLAARAAIAKATPPA